MDTLRIGSVYHDNRSGLWCGPAVISSVTGNGTKEITDMLRAFRSKVNPDRRHRIAGVTNHEIVSVLLESGVIPEILSDYVMEPQPPTLRRWLQRVPESDRVDPILIRQTGHFLVVQGRRFVDNGHPVPTFIRDAPRRARVLSAWRLVSISQFATVEEFRRAYELSNEVIPGMVSTAASQ